MRIDPDEWVWTPDNDNDLLWSNFRPVSVSQILQLICDHLRMLTNSDMGGVERITVSTQRPQFNAKPRHTISLYDLSADGHSVQTGLIPPHGLFIVKGWTRMVCCYTVMAAAFLSPEILKARLCAVPVQWVTGSGKFCKQ